MPTIYYDFSASSDGVGTSNSPRNTWITPGNNDVIRIKRGNTWRRTSQLNLSTIQGLTFEAWFNADGTDDPSQPKPIISIVTTSGGAINIQGTGIHVFRNLRFAEFRHPSDPNAATPNALNFGATGTQDASDGASGEFYGCEFVGINGNAIQWNGISSATFAAFAAPRGVVRHCYFDDIGGDAVFAKVRTYFEVGYCRMTNLSTRTATGDGVGFLDANPALAWVHDNYIDRSNNDYKQCIIIDGVDGSGFALIERNICIGFGSSSTSANSNVVVNVDGCVAHIRQNDITCFGVGVSVNTNGAIISSNLFKIYNYRAGFATIDFLVSTSQVVGNTFICFSRAEAVIASGSGRSGNAIRNNAVQGAGTFYLQGVASSATLGYNAFENVSQPYFQSGGGALALQTGDIVTSLTLAPNYAPLAASPLLRAGVHLGYTRDIMRRQRQKPPTIGAFDAARTRIL